MSIDSSLMTANFRARLETAAKQVEDFSRWAENIRQI